MLPVHAKFRFFQTFRMAGFYHSGVAALR